MIGARLAFQDYGKIGIRLPPEIQYGIRLALSQYPIIGQWDQIKERALKCLDSELRSYQWSAGNDLVNRMHKAAWSWRYPRIEHPKEAREKADAIKEMLSKRLAVALIDGTIHLPPLEYRNLTERNVRMLCGEVGYLQRIGDRLFRYPWCPYCVSSQGNIEDYCHKAIKP